MSFATQREILPRRAGLAFQEVINGPAGISLALGLAQVMPPRQGYWLAKRLGSRFAQLRKNTQVEAVEANQSIVGQGKLSSADLRRITQATFQATARCLYDFYHNIDRPKSILELVEIDSSLKKRIEEHRASKCGLLMASLHFSNFDLALRAAVLSGLRAQVLSLARPVTGTRLQNRIRDLDGMEITPISFTSLQKALRRLKNGGIVVTGIDRPTNDSRFRPVFFGRPSSLPVGYIQLALKTDVPVVVVTGRTLADGHYCVQASDPFPMRRFKDTNEEVLWNTEEILRVVEQIIRWDPKQWSMFYPVWPDTASQN